MLNLQQHCAPLASVGKDHSSSGKESYRIVSYFDQFEYRNEAPLFRRLSELFELSVYGLNLVKQVLEREQLSRRQDQPKQPPPEPRLALTNVAQY